ncbi:MAG: SAM-dependent methyltransferase, partial [Lentisphaeraceae bacterium]|nr:SAM-dependent methyltransferase [Lentisphaeraceae bacterium]
MLNNLKYLEIDANKPLSKDGVSYITKSLNELSCSEVKLSPEKPSIEFLLKELSKDTADFFLWSIDSAIENLPDNMDFFYINEISTAVIFKAGNKDMQIVRNYFITPVAFVGGGPGNDEWMTIEAKIILDHCDIVFYDALVNPLIVASLHEDVERFYVGKRGDSTSFNQDELNDLIALYSRKGYKVGRLKGGDPGVLGRITEEIDTLTKYNLSYQIVPGISAMQALSACAGLFLTQRGVCDRVTLTTARSAGGQINNL